jgi:hypothetical protein
VFYAEVVADSEDPLFIVPAVLPGDEPGTKSSDTATVTPAHQRTDKPTIKRPDVAKKSPSSPDSQSNGATTQVVAVAAPGEAPDTANAAEKSRRTIRFERPAIRRTTRIIRYIDPWSVFRVALLAHFVLYLVLLLAGVLLWNVANATGTVDNVERFMESFGWESFEFNGGELFHQAWVLGLFAVVGLTGLVVLAVTTFNLITDLVGGIRLTVLENRPGRRTTGKQEIEAQSRIESKSTSGIGPGG